jgi:hypothetical protein
MKNREKQQEWIFEATKWLLGRMGYDVEKDVHKQFMKKYHKELVENKTDFVHKPGPKTKPDYFQKFL